MRAIIQQEVLYNINIMGFESAPKRKNQNEPEKKEDYALIQEVVSNDSEVTNETPIINDEGQYEMFRLTKAEELSEESIDLTNKLNKKISAGEINSQEVINEYLLKYTHIYERMTIMIDRGIKNDSNDYVVLKNTALRVRENLEELKEIEKSLNNESN